MPRASLGWGVEEQVTRPLLLLGLRNGLLRLCEGVRRLKWVSSWLPALTIVDRLYSNYAFRHFDWRIIYYRRQSDYLANLISSLLPFKKIT